MPRLPQNLQKAFKSQTFWRSARSNSRLCVPLRFGEAAKSIPQVTRDLAPHIAWREITAMRDKLIHHYFGVDTEIVWETTLQDVPTLIVELQALLARLRA
jgi:uncharacterized protein with HEPN domain